MSEQAVIEEEQGSTKWRRCSTCGRVLQAELFEAGTNVCLDDARKKAAPDRRASRTPDSDRAAKVRLHRAKTGNAYGKAYGKARTEAVAELIAERPEDFARLLSAARIRHGLGPGR